MITLCNMVPSWIFKLVKYEHPATKAIFGSGSFLQLFSLLFLCVRKEKVTILVFAIIKDASNFLFKRKINQADNSGGKSNAVTKPKQEVNEYVRLKDFETVQYSTIEWGDYLDVKKCKANYRGDGVSK